MVTAIATIACMVVPAVTGIAGKPLIQFTDSHQEVVVIRVVDGERSDYDAGVQARRHAESPALPNRLKQLCRAVARVSHVLWLTA
jgi:hypothetical protein